MDGLGGGYSSVSKVAVLDADSQPKGDINYLFGQVSVKERKIDWSGSCGNLVSAVAVWAIEEGFLPCPEEATTTTVQVWNANHGKMVHAHVPTSEGAPEADGSFIVDGVGHTGAEIRIDFLDPGGSSGGSVLPTGLALETIEWGGRAFPATLVNAGNPTVIVDASALGLDATEQADRIHGDAGLMETVEALRCLGAVRMGIGNPEDPGSITTTHPAAPKIAWVAPMIEKEGGSNDAGGGGGAAPRRSCHLSARIMSMGQLHHAFTGTGAAALAVAAAIPGTVVHRAAAVAAGDKKEGSMQLLTIHHNSGEMTVGAEVGPLEGGGFEAERVAMSRSARRLMEGAALIPKGVWPES